MLKPACSHSKAEQVSESKPMENYCPRRHHPWAKKSPSGNCCRPGSVWWEQQPVLSLSLQPSGHLLLAQGAGLGEPRVCLRTGATSPQGPTPAWPGVSGVCSHTALILLQQFILFLTLHSHKCQDFGLACCAAARSTCTSTRRFVLARQGEQLWKHRRPGHLCGQLCRRRAPRAGGNSPGNQLYSAEWEGVSYRELVINQG